MIESRVKEVSGVDPVDKLEAELFILFFIFHCAIYLFFLSLVIRFFIEFTCLLHFAAKQNTDLAFYRVIREVLNFCGFMNILYTVQPDRLFYSI